MEKCEEPMVRRDHAEKASGRTRYLADWQVEGVLTGRFVRAEYAHARMLSVRLPPLPAGYFVVDRNDVPGENRVPLGLDDTPVFAEDFVQYVGEPILLVVGPDPAQVERMAKAVEVSYEPLPALLDPERSDVTFYQYAYDKGDWQDAFAQADFVMEETFRTGQQEHVHLETNAMMAEFHQGKLTVTGSLQCPFYVHRAVAKVMDMPLEKVRIVQSPTGGAFGGKEDFPSILGAQVAVAAHKAGKPVRVVLDRQEDMAYTPKRHPSVCHYRAAVQAGRVTGLDIDVRYDAGAYSTLSAVVLMRGTICAAGVYTIPNLHVQGRAVKTNSVPNGAFRGFGGPQVFFSIEMFMAHIARRLKEDEVQFKLRHVARQGDITSTGGQYHFPVVVPEMTARILEMSGYVEKRKRYAREIGGRYRWGIGFALALHGCGFTGNGERDIIQAVARLRGLADGKVEILVGNTEMGQGLQTTFAKLVSERMGLPMECILLREPDTDRVSDAGPTVASRSIMVVGQLLLRACDELKAQWKPGQEITVETHYEHPPFMIPFDAGKLQGDAYPDFSWSANVVEVEVDTLTAEIRVLDAWGVYDVGVPVDRQIVQGQMQGGLVQAIGYGSTEKMSYNDKGVIRNDHLSDYILPTAMDVGRIEVDFVINPYPYGPLGAKGAGELPHVGGAPAYLAAVENALHTDLSAIPFSAEDAMQVLRKGGEIS